MTISTILASVPGIIEILVILIGIAILLAVANYGKNTSLGYFGSLLLAIFTTPLIAFFIILIFFKKDR
ncbi:hypothetical protein G7074_03235 [Pedobacter sp. HDW13]|uniref:hypothetical protein n=1 Tax=unclassified Pedobacter TaxID=2628915 RepID=UPI000F5B2EB6|nr:MULTISPECIES: hypothetical protein [unclassified Pedobacter]QIL38377.1 hypothetical protein G7074_03235 [Pedobacter sp. HDW13]RQO73797.1 hypothetical protein DBR40_13400 [Pedobacter sp. KBW01]